MRITKDEIESAGINLKGWLGAIQREAKESGVSFQIKGPISRQVRVRRARVKNPSVGASTRTWAFHGGEQFRIGGIVSDQIPGQDAWSISVTLIPAKVDLVAEMSGMTMSLDDCFINLEGFEEWAGTFDATKHFEQTNPVEPVKKRLTLQEERELNPMWGRW